MEGMEYNVTQESVDYMNNTAASLEEVQERLTAIVAALKSAYEENADGLGAHSADISSLIEDLEGLIDSSNNAIKILVLKLVKAATIRQSHIDTNNYGSLGRSR